MSHVQEEHKRPLFSIPLSVWIALITVIGGASGAIIGSYYQQQVAEREISLSLITHLSNQFLQEKPIVITPNSTKADINAVLQHKETAYITRQLARHLKDNHAYIDFRSLLATLTSIERRYSYAQIYQYSELGYIVCENIELRADRHTYIVSSKNGRCSKSLLEGVTLSLASDVDNPIDVENYRFRLAVENDINSILCDGDKISCKFWIDLGDRLESTPYEYLVLAEYIGYSLPFSQQQKNVYFSIMKRRIPVINVESESNYLSATSDTLSLRY